MAPFCTQCLPLRGCAAHRRIRHERSIGAVVHAVILRRLLSKPETPTEYWWSTWLSRTRMLDGRSRGYGSDSGTPLSWIHPIAPTKWFSPVGVRHWICRTRSCARGSRSWSRLIRWDCGIPSSASAASNTHLLPYLTNFTDAHDLAPLCGSIARLLLNDARDLRAI